MANDKKKLQFGPGTDLIGLSLLILFVSPANRSYVI